VGIRSRHFKQQLHRAADGQAEFDMYVTANAGTLIRPSPRREGRWPRAGVDTGSSAGVASGCCGRFFEEQELQAR
jgi:hypothetical protein